MVKEPKTLVEATLYFSDPQNCHDYMVAKRWPNGPVCPVCGATKVAFLKTVNRFQCSKRHPRRQFTIKTGSIFEDSPLGLDKWLVAIWLIVNAKNGISSYELHRAIEVTQKSAWFMNHRIRLALRNGSFEKLVDHVEADETGIGGASKNLHKHVRERRGIKMGKSSLTTVAGVLERDGEIRLRVIERTDLLNIHDFVKSNVLKGSKLYTDTNNCYHAMDQWYTHEIINHSIAYVRDNVHTNGLENFWSLLKRTMRGTYVSVEPFHLQRYLDEYAFRFNERKSNDGERFRLATSQVSGKRLTYKRLTGQEEVHLV